MNKLVRAACVDRAEGCCESCGRGFDSFERVAELDHARGRKNAPDSVETCWMLCRACHHQKTNNRPNRAYWIRRFFIHAERFGYSEQMARCEKDIAWIHAKSASAS